MIKQANRKMYSILVVSLLAIVFPNRKAEAGGAVFDRNGGAQCSAAYSRGEKNAFTGASDGHGSGSSNSGSSTPSGTTQYYGPGVDSSRPRFCETVFRHEIPQGRAFNVNKEVCEKEARKALFVELDKLEEKCKKSSGSVAYGGSTMGYNELWGDTRRYGNMGPNTLDFSSVAAQRFDSSSNKIKATYSVKFSCAYEYWYGRTETWVGGQQLSLTVDSDMATMMKEVESLVPRNLAKIKNDPYYAVNSRLSESMTKKCEDVLNKNNSSKTPFRADKLVGYHVDIDKPNALNVTYGNIDANDKTKENIPYQCIAQPVAQFSCIAQTYGPKTLGGLDYYWFDAKSGTIQE